MALFTAHRVHDGEVLTPSLAVRTVGAAAVYVPPSASNRRLVLTLPSLPHISTCRVSKIYLCVNFITSNTNKPETKITQATRTSQVTSRVPTSASLLRTWNAAFRPGDTAVFKLVKNNLISRKPAPPSRGKKKKKKRPSSVSTQNPKHTLYFSRVIPLLLV